MLTDKDKEKVDRLVSELFGNVEYWTGEEWIKPPVLAMLPEVAPTALVTQAGGRFVWSTLSTKSPGGSAPTREEARAAALRALEEGTADVS